MLIRLSGGESGIKDYLENGHKQGRAYSRDELDERVILEGDLKITDTLISHMNQSGDKYLHITLAFKEDEISHDRLQAITQDFKEFAFTAFQDDEYHFYAEAHLPRIKSYSHAKTGERVERKPHIHIVIPKYNLLSGEGLNPFGLVERQVKYLEAIQETLNNRYGLASPKDNRRVLFSDDSDLFSRYKGDTFKGGSKAFKSALLSDILSRPINCYDDFKKRLAEHGEVKIRNEGKANEYLWVKPKSEANGQGINLRDAAFSRDFIELPPLEKMQRLATESRYETATSPRANATAYERALQEWQTQRAKEIKYVYLGKRREYDAYQHASPEEKAQLLIDREQRFYQKHLRKNIEEDPQTALISDMLGTVADPLKTKNRTAPAIQRNASPQTSVIGQLLHDLQTDREEVASHLEFAVIKQDLDAHRLLARLSHSHGVNPDHYPISKGRDGGDRIQAGSRKLNVSDFLTQEMNLNYRTAGQLLREIYQEQTEQTAETLPRQPACAALWQTYQAERQASAAIRKAERQAKQTAERLAIKAAHQRQLDGIRAHRKLSPAERKAATSIAKMERIQAETACREQAKSERQRLAALHRDEYQNGYQNWLASQAKTGHESALMELRRLQAKVKKTTGSQEIHTGSEAQYYEASSAFLLKGHSLSYHVHRDGTVTYRRGDTDWVRDEGLFVTVLQSQDDAIETGLRLAQVKFGKKLTVRGSDAFKTNVARVAAEKGLWVEFTDHALNELMATRKAELQQRRPQTVEQPQPAPTTQTIKPPSLLSSLAPNTVLGFYTGEVVGIDSRYVYQTLGKDIIRHNLALFSRVPAQGEKIRISYRQGEMRVEPVQEKNNTRSRGR
jgi:hypothetical protein